MTLLGKYNNTLKRKVFDLPKNAHYTCPEIQNELLTMMADKIQKEIVCDVLNAQFFCVMSDESKDCTNIEQLVISFRYLEQT